MTVAAGGMAYLTIVSYQETTQVQTSGGIEQVVTQSKKTLKVESIKEGRIYVRNTGDQDLEDLSFYIDGRPVNVTGIQCAPGKTCVYTIQETVECGTDDECDLQISDYMFWFCH